MTKFIIDQTSREALTADRAKELLKDLDAGVDYVKLSGKSFGDGSAQIAAEALERSIPTLTYLNIADIIASRPEDEAKRALTIISDSLESCKHLKLIDLSDNALGAKGIRAVGTLLAGQEALEELFLCNNGLAADAGDLITEALLETTPTKLCRLHFHNNLLETAGAISLAPIVENSPKLEDFRFSSLRLGREGAVRICEALKERIGSTLKHLNLSDNNFGEEGAEALTEALSNAPCLETLILNDALLGDDGVKLICEALAKGAPKLVSLNISGNEVGVEGAKGLAKLLARGTLKELKAEDNELGNSGAKRIAKGLKKSSTITSLNVCSSEVGGTGALAIATEAAKLKCLEKIAMNGNAIPAGTVEEIENLLGDKLGSLSDNDEDDDEEDDEDEDDLDDDDEDDEKDENVEKEAKQALSKTEAEELSGLADKISNIGL